jgi:chemotaxis protein CheX
MMSQTEVVTAVYSSTKDVFSTMLGMEVDGGEPYTETAAPGPSDGIIGLIGLAGAWVGTASICCNAAMGCRISSAMLGMEYSEVDDDVLDAVSEITNMIIGSFKNQAENFLGPLGLSIPTVIFGLNFSARTAGKEQWIVTPFTCGSDRLEVKVCLSPNRGLPRMVTHSAQLAQSTK